MSNLHDDMNVDPEEYNGPNRGIDLEAKLKNFYPQKKPKKEEKQMKCKSTKALLKFKDKKEILNVKNKKYGSTQVDKFKVKKIKNKINKNSLEIKLIKKSENEKIIEESLDKKYKEESKFINNNSDKESEIDYNYFHNENLINYNYKEPYENNIMEMEMEKNGDLFEKENADLIREINENKNFECIPSEESYINNSESTVILFIGYS